MHTIHHYIPLLVTSWRSRMRGKEAVTWKGYSTNMDILFLFWRMPMRRRMMSHKLVPAIVVIVRQKLKDNYLLQFFAVMTVRKW